MSNAVLVISEQGIPAAVPQIKLAIEAALSNCALIGTVKDTQAQANAVLALRENKRLLKDVESARKIVKQKYLDICREIDATAKREVGELEDETTRLDIAVANFQQDQMEIAREKERERQRGLDRIEAERVEAERQARAAEEKEEADRQSAARKIREEQEAAAAEQKRREDAAAAEAKRIQEQAANAKNKKQREEAERQRLELEAKQREEKELARIAEEKRNAEMQRLAQEQASAKAQLEAQEQEARERATQAGEALGGPVVAATAKGQTSKEVHDYEVTDVWLLVRTNPGLVKVEAIRSEILNLLNNHGVREIKGLRIFPVVKNQIRAGRVINV